MVTTCLVSGQLVDSKGQLLSGGTVRFSPTLVVKGEDLSTILPVTVDTQTDSSAEFSIQLVPDTYTVTYLDEEGRQVSLQFTIVVPPLDEVPLEAIRIGSPSVAIVLSGGDATDVAAIVLSGGGA